MKHAAALVLALALLPSAALAEEKGWTGYWKLDEARSMPGAKDAAAEDYRFTVTGDRIRWEIPSLHEVLEGRTDGVPMVVHRPGAPEGMTIAVKAEGPFVLTYKVAIKGKPAGGGRMTLVEDGKVWSDISWGAGHEAQAGALIYARS